MYNILPEAVRGRHDKMGFVTPEETWLHKQDDSWFRDNIDAALEAFPGIFRADKLNTVIDNFVTGKSKFSSLPWRMACLGSWAKKSST